VNLILDPIGASYWEKNFSCIATAGRWIFIASMSGKDVPLNLGALMGKRAQIIGSTLRGLPLDDKREAVKRFETQFHAALEEGKLKPVIDQVFPAAQAGAAHQRMESNLNIGKILLSWIEHEENTADFHGK